MHRHSSPLQRPDDTPVVPRATAHAARRVVARKRAACQPVSTTREHHPCACAGLPTGTTPPPHGQCINPSMNQLQIDLPPKPLRSGAPALHGPAASGAPNQEQAAQQRGGDGMDFDDARSEISHAGSHPDSESSSSSFRGNRGAPLHAIGSSRPYQSPKIRPRVGGNHQAEIDSLLAQIVEEQQNETPAAWHLVYLS